MQVTVVYYCENRIESDRSLRPKGVFRFPGGEVVSYESIKAACCVWGPHETGTMTLEQADLDHLVSKGLTVLGVCDTSS